MTTPLATIFHGDITLEVGSNTDQFGWGDLDVNRNCTIRSTQDASGNTVGALSVAGGLSLALTANLNRALSNGSGNALNVLYGRTNLIETHIDTTLGPATITGGNKVDINVGASSNFISSGGNLLLSSSLNSLQLYGGLNSTQAVDIQATNEGGGVSVLAGSGTGRVSIVSGSGGIHGYASNGNITLTSSNGTGSFLVNTANDNQNLNVRLVGATDSQILIESSGTNIQNTALVLSTSHSSGSILIANNSTGNGSGSITTLVGYGGYTLRTNTGGSIAMSSQGASSEYKVLSNGQDQNLSLLLEGDTQSAIILKSSGTNTSGAIFIQSSNTNGSIVIANTQGSVGKVLVDTHSFVTNASNGGILMTSYGAPSTYTNATTIDNQNLTVSVSGNTNSKVIISSTGTSNEAIKLETTSNSGGISLLSMGALQLQSSDLNNGVRIGTGPFSGVPVQIGNNSTTTISGNLIVQGTTTTINSEVVTIKDNIMVVNNIPLANSNGGVAIKRYQTANNTNGGNVVEDAPEYSGMAQGGTLTSITLTASSSPVNDFFADYWIRIVSGQGANQVRKIKSYDGNTKIALIYDNIDYASNPTNPNPREGMDFLTSPNNTSTYELYPCHYVMNIWDESANEFVLGCSSGPDKAIEHYSNLHINNLNANGLFASTLNGNVADISGTVVLQDNSTSYVTIDSFPLTYGVYQVFVKPSTLLTRAHAIFMIGRVSEANTPGTIVRIISVKGAQGEQLDMVWDANSKPQIYYRPAPGVPGTTTFNVKIVTL